MKYEFGEFQKWHYINVKYVGYWNDENNQYPEYPMPVINQTTKQEIKENLEKLQFLITHPLVKEIPFKGFSICRICEKHNGSSEYYVRVGKNEYIIIPDGYLHYIEEHGIKMDDVIHKVYDFYKNKIVYEKMKTEKWKR